MKTTDTPKNDSSTDGKVNSIPSGESESIALYVGIGASAGGLEAIQTFFQHMASSSPLAFIVIQHLSPDYKSMMVELLSKKTTIPVRRAEDGMKVEANAIYLIPPKKNLKIFHGRLLLSDQDHSRGINLPIDIFLHSLADDQGERAAAIILSGTGSDGMRGIRAIKEQGGLVMVQKEETAKFNGMPRAAISTGLVDFILAPDAMPKQLISYLTHPYVAKNDRAHRIIDDENGLTRVFSMLRERYKVDFTFYKPSTVTRRIERRMTVNQIVDINEYAVFAKNHPAEISTLYRELLIGVTRFFRDSDAFQALTERWLPSLLDGSDVRELRFWVTGCSTGEEAYTLAILARECMQQMGITRDIKIFATDLDRDAIAKAGTGIYPESIAADVATELLTKYFYRKDENFHIIRNIREMVVFAQHNLIRDPPFTHIDLVTCRNLLIYLQPVLQKKVLDMINFSLHPGGILMLGLSETVGERHDLFEMVDQKQKIYRSTGKRQAAIHRDGTLIGVGPGADRLSDRMLKGRQTLRVSDAEHTLQRFVDALAGEFIPLSIIVNEQLEVQHLVGDSTGLFRLPSGRPVNDITKMVAKELAIPLSTGIQKVYRTHKPHIFSNIRVNRQDRIQSFKMTIKPLPEKRGQESLVAVVIEEMRPLQAAEEPGDARVFDLGRETEQYLRDMEHELQFTRENLQATIEELETANEELQATNEELLASNEELQSTNEELQSTNEELHTVNIEYQNKIIELTELNNDVENLLADSQVGTLLLDDNLEIRRFSSKIRDIFQVLEADIGRPLTHLTHDLADVDPVGVVRQVMGSKQTVEMAVRTGGGRWHLMRVKPYQIGPEIYSGTVLSFVDISELKRSQRELEENDRNYRQVQEIAKIGNWELDIANNHLQWSENIYAMFEVDPQTFDGTYGAFLDLVHPDDRERLDLAYKHSVETKTPYNIVHRLLLKDGRIKHINEICRTEYDPRGRPLRSLGTVQDITEQKRLEERLSASEDRYRALFDTISSGVAVYRAVDGGQDFEFIDFNRTAEKIEHIRREDLVGKRLTRVFPGAGADFGLLDVLRRVWQTGRAEKHPISFYEDGRISGWRENQVYQLPSGDVVAVYNDVTGQKETESSLHMAQNEKALILENISEAITHLGLDRRIKWISAAAAGILAQKPENLVGRHCHTVWCTDENGCDDGCPFQQAVQTGQAAQGTVRDAHGRPWRIKASPVRNSSQALVGIVEMRWPVE